jgi:hypothetical protein
MEFGSCVSRRTGVLCAVATSSILVMSQGARADDWRQVLSYKIYYNETRTHLPLNKDAPSRCAVQATGRILCLPILRGLHHQYGRI